MQYSSNTDFFSMHAMYVPKDLENVPAQVLTQLRHCVL